MMKQIGEIPQISTSEVLELRAKYETCQNTFEREQIETKIIRSHIYIAYAVISQYFDALVEEHNDLEMIAAAQIWKGFLSYDETKGASFKTYVSRYIRWRMHDYVYYNVNNVNSTEKSVINRATFYLRLMEEEHMSIEEIAREFKIKEEKIRADISHYEAKNQFLPPTGKNNDDVFDVFVDPNPTPDMVAERKERIRDIADYLELFYTNELDRAIFNFYFDLHDTGNRMTYQEIADFFGVSKSFVYSKINRLIKEILRKEQDNNGFLESLLKKG